MTADDRVEHDVDYINDRDTLKQAVAKMDRLGAEVMPVFHNHKPLGIITKQDIMLYASLKQKDSEIVTVRQIMRQP